MQKFEEPYDQDLKVDAPEPYSPSGLISLSSGNTYGLWIVTESGPKRRGLIHIIEFLFLKTGLLVLIGTLASGKPIRR